jgi:hypothetical protein
MRDNGEPPRFYCDAMLGGLARWLRAGGYDAAFEHGIDDGELVQRAQRQGRIILSCDGGLFERSLLRDGVIPSLQVPRQLSKFQQLRFVADELELARRPPRCMACGGELRELPKHTVADEAPPLAMRHCDRFWRCSRCGKLLWRGTHWQRIERKLEEIFDGR